MKDELQELCIKIANGNQEAFEFIILWNGLCHSIDDVVDCSGKNPEFIIKSFMSVFSLCEHPFYKKYSASLYSVIVLTANAFADSNDERLIILQIKDTLRFYGNEMLMWIAFITGGHQLMREISWKLRAISYNEHHGSSNQPI